MKISFICNHIYINGGWSPWDTRIGGSEEFIVEVSKRLKHDVQVFHNGKHGIYESVMYKPHLDYQPRDVTININYPELEPHGKTIYWSSLTNNPNLDKFDAVCGISEYAKQHTNLPERTVLIPPGYDETKIYPEKKIPKQCFYASSPDRGLDTLLEAWPKVHRAHPDATLLVTYGADVNLPGVINLGEVDEQTMNDIYRTSDVWCHPANGGELYCMTGIKAQAAGCVPVVIPTMALAETVRAGITSTKEDYADDLIEILGNAPEKKLIREELAKEHFPTWQDSTDKLLEIIHEVLQ